MSELAASRPASASPSWLWRHRWSLALLGVLALFMVWRGLGLPTQFPETWNLHLREPIDDFRYWVIGNRNTHWLFVYFFTPLSDVIDWSIRRIENLLLWLPWPWLVAATALLGYWLGGRRVALVSSLSLFLMGLLGLWTESMQTLALILVSVGIALTLGIPLGIWAARNDRVDATLRPILDAMQTMPAFVYLIPVLLFFGIARVPAVIATVIYALPPAIRLTSLGIRQVPHEAVEAAHSFGSTSRQLLLKVQIPLALPTIMAGVNQTIMMALGIVVIAALIGAGGLGREVLVGLQRLRVGQAFAAGLAIVLMAILLDRLSQAAAKRLAGTRRSRRYGPQQEPPLARYLPGWARRRPYLGLLLGLTAVVFLVHWFVTDLQTFPEAWKIPIEAPVDAFVRWMRDNLYEIGATGLGAGPFSDFLTIFILTPLRALFTLWLPWVVVIALAALLAATAGGWRLALGTGAGLFLMGLLGMWTESM
ncbi:MAG: ABC transporter permease subunit, partial [Chloroflexi bacterium]|nr:ABC transporter permease subunit [Chloroflexota bacterium]